MRVRISYDVLPGAKDGLRTMLHGLLSVRASSYPCANAFLSPHRSPCAGFSGSGIRPVRTLKALCNNP
jgi:hypothetical protein